MLSREFSLYVSERLFIHFLENIILNMKETILKGLKWDNKQMSDALEFHCSDLVTCSVIAWAIGGKSVFFPLK